MIISRTPFRISFFGGGTDYPVWYRAHGGAVLATTINKYCYLTCRTLPPFFEYKSRIVWSKVEHVGGVEDIQHPAVREVLKFLQVTEGLSLHHDGDLPARTGLGSSSSFTVGLLHALHGLKGVMPGKHRLAAEALHVEQERLREHVGSQDQVIAAFGGLNRITFPAQGAFEVTPIIVSEERLCLLQDHLMLFFTGLSRNASEIAAEQVKATGQKTTELSRMREMVDEAIEILQSAADLSAFGELLDEGWQLKRSLTGKISTRQIDAMYEAARRAGAVGGKLLGAGGGGFLLLFARPEDQDGIRGALGGLLHVPFRFDSSGSRIIFYEQDQAVQSAAAAKTLKLVAERT